MPVNTWAERLHLFFGSGKSRSSERRVGPRYRLELDVTITSRDRRLHARSNDMGQDGMGIYCSADLGIGEEVLLQYELGDGSPPKKVRGTVRDRNGNRYGVEFVE